MQEFVDRLLVAAQAGGGRVHAGLARVLAGLAHAGLSVAVETKVTGPGALVSLEVGVRPVFFAACALDSGVLSAGLAVGIAGLALEVLEERAGGALFVALIFVQNVVSVY